MSHKRSNSSRPLTLGDHLRQMRKQFPAIRPYEEEANENWWNDGLDALGANRLELAERIFKKLVLAQPQHFDGYYGLAQVYQRQRHAKHAILFADEAIRLAQAFLDDGTLDSSTIDELRQFRLALDAPASAATAEQKSHPG